MKVNRIEKLIGLYEDAIVKITALEIEQSELVNDFEHYAERDNEWVQNQEQRLELYDIKKNIVSSVIYAFHEELIPVYGKISVFDIVNNAPDTPDFLDDIVPMVRKIMLKEDMEEVLRVNRAVAKSKVEKI